MSATVTWLCMSVGVDGWECMCAGVDGWECMSGYGRVGVHEWGCGWVGEHVCLVHHN